MWMNDWITATRLLMILLIRLFKNSLNHSPFRRLFSLSCNPCITFLWIQLCLAVADLAVQMPQWTDPVKDLVEKLVSLGTCLIVFSKIIKLLIKTWHFCRFSKTIQMIPALLEILQYLTEEVMKISVHSIDLTCSPRLKCNEHCKIQLNSSTGYYQ